MASETRDLRSDRPARGRPRREDGPPLSRRRVVEEALRLIDEEGVQALTMRALAQRLGVEAMSLYTHVSGKDDLLDAVADLVAEEIRLESSPDLDWQERIRRAVWAWARMEQRHPRAFHLIYRDREGTDREKALNEELMAALATAGFDAPRMALAYQTLVSFLDGALLHWPRSSWNAARHWGWVATHIDSGRYPRLAQTAPFAAQLEWDTVFEAGLELLLRGLADGALGS